MFSFQQKLLHDLEPLFFNLPFKEKKSQIVTIKEVTFAGLKAVIDNIYKTKIKLTTKNLPDILSAAHLTQMTRIVEKCKEWMLENMRNTNCLTFLKLAEKYNFGNVENAANEFVLKNFFDICKTASFFEISQDSLCKYLSSDFLRTDFKEHEVFKSAKSWIKQNKVTNEQDIFDIMKNVRFALIPPSMLSTEIMYDDMVQKISDCLKLVVEAMSYHMNVYTQPLYTGNLNKPRGKPGLLVISYGLRGDGFNVQGNGEDIHCLSFSEPEKAKVISNMEMPIVWDSMSCIQRENFLYLFGVISSEYYQNFTKRYDSATNSWIDLKSIPRCPAIGASIASVGEDIYLSGGLHVNNNSPYETGEGKLDEVMVYSISKNTWSVSDPLPVKCVYSSACSNQGNVYVAGGFVKNETTKNLFIYDTKAKLWLTKQPMIRARCQHVLEAVNDKVYAIGGRGSMAIRNASVNSAEVYDPRVDQWTIILDNSKRCIHSGASSFVHDQKIYVVGGTRDINHFTKFDVQQKTILELLKFKFPLSSQKNVWLCMNLPKLL